MNWHGIFFGNFNQGDLMRMSHRVFSLARLLSVALAMGCLMLSACATKPQIAAEEPSLIEQQKTVLRDLGFAEEGDDWLMTIAVPPCMKSL